MYCTSQTDTSNAQLHSTLLTVTCLALSTNHVADIDNTTTNNNTTSSRNK